MAVWIYEGRDRKGSAVSGKHEAPDRQSALEALRAQGLFLTRIEPEKTAGGSLFGVKNSSVAPQAPKFTAEAPQVPSPPAVAAVASGMGQGAKTATGSSQARAGDSPQPSPRIATGIPSGASAPPIPRQPLLSASNQALATFYSQMASLLHSGVGLSAALESLSKHAQSGALRSAAGQMRERVASGQPLSQGMASFPGLFSPLALGIVEAGERGGFLESSFTRLAKYAERDYELQQAIKRQTWYPKLLVFAAILIPGVVPLVLRGFGAFIAQVGPPLLIIGLLGGLWLAWKKFSPSLVAVDPIRNLWDSLKLYLPVIGKVSRGLATAKFCRALSALYGAGVAMPTAIKLSGEASGNEALSQRAKEIVPRLQSGDSLTQCLPDVGKFHPMALQMVAVGEQSGALDQQLEKAADFLEADAETAVRQAIPVLGIVVFLAVAAYIGSQVISAFGGYVNSLNELTDP